MYTPVGRSETTFNITGLQPATEYYFAINIVLGDNTFGYNTVASFETSTLDGCKLQNFVFNYVSQRLWSE